MDIGPGEDDVHLIFYYIMEMNSLRELRFPQELIDLVVDNLCHDKMSLKHCSVLASPWMHSCYRYLFLTLIFPQYSKTGIPETLNGFDFLCRRPSFTPYVRKLHLQSLFTSQPMLAAILNMFPALETLTIEGIIFRDLQLSETALARTALHSTQRISLDRVVIVLKDAGSNAPGHFLCPIFDSLDAVNELRFEDATVHRDIWNYRSSMAQCTSRHATLAASSVSVEAYELAPVLEDIRSGVNPSLLQSLRLTNICIFTTLSYLDGFLSAVPCLENIDLGFNMIRPNPHTCPCPLFHTPDSIAHDFYCSDRLAS